MQVTPYFLLTAALFTVQIIIFADTLKYHNKKAAKELIAGIVLIMTGLAFFGASLLIIESPAKFILHELKFLTIAFYPPCILMFYLKFANKHISFKAKAALCVVPLITVVLVLTNNFHHLFRKELYILIYKNATYVDTDNSIWFWVHTAYSYILILISFVFLLTEHFKKPKVYRDQTMIIFFSGLMAAVVSALSAFGVIYDVGDITLIVFALITIMHYLAVIKYSSDGLLSRVFNLLSGRPGAVQVLRDIVIREINNPVLIFDHNLMLVDANESASDMFDIDGSDYGVMHMGKFINTRGIKENEIYHEKHDMYFNISEKSIYGEKGMFTGRLMVFNDITALKRSVNELEELAKKDYLTGAKNRTAFYEEALKITKDCLPAAFIAVNLNRTKLINDIFGLEYGDKIIIKAAGIIAKECAGAGVCARMNGDEFCVMLKNSDIASAESFIGRITTGLKEQGTNIETCFEIMTSLEQDAKSIIYNLSDKSAKEKSISGNYGILDMVRHKIGNNEKITELCLYIAKKLNIGENLVSKIPLLCMTRDIGLLSVSDQIIKNIGNLTNEQWEEFKMHTIRGHNIAFSSPELRSISKEILYHHERYDGYGYPHMLKGGDIPILSRILAAAEFYEAGSKKKEDTATQLGKRKGTQFDPEVVDALIECVNQINGGTQ